MDMSWVVYMLRCKDGTLYTGSTNDINRRLKEHNDSKSDTRYTRTRRPVSLVYTEEVDSIGSARSREAALKRLSKKEKESLVLLHQ